MTEISCKGNILPSKGKLCEKKERNFLTDQVICHVGFHVLHKT